jgi:hypothetical protein
VDMCAARFDSTMLDSFGIFYTRDARLSFHTAKTRSGDAVIRPKSFRRCGWSTHRPTKSATAILCHHPPRRPNANPHSARGTSACHFPRFPSLEAFGRRPQASAVAAPSVTGRHPKPLYERGLVKTLSALLVCPLDLFVRPQAPIFPSRPAGLQSGARWSCQGWPSHQPCGVRRACQATPCRVGRGVATPTPHRPGCADFPLPVLHGRASRTSA